MHRHGVPGLFEVNCSGDTHDPREIVDRWVAIVVRNKTTLRTCKQIKRALLHTPVSVPVRRRAHNKKVGRHMPGIRLWPVVTVDKQGSDLIDCFTFVSSCVDDDENTVLLQLVIYDVVAHFGQPALEIALHKFVIVFFRARAVGQEPPTYIGVTGARQKLQETLYRAEIYVFFFYRHRVSGRVKYELPRSAHIMTAEAEVKSDAAEELDVVVEIEYPAGQEIDEQRRAYIIGQMACADIDGKVLVHNMDQVYRWLKSGEVENVGLRGKNGRVHNEGAPFKLRADPIADE